MTWNEDWEEELFWEEVREGCDCGDCDVCEYLESERKDAQGRAKAEADRLQAIRDAFGRLPRRYGPEA